VLLPVVLPLFFEVLRAVSGHFLGLVIQAKVRSPAG
jgi:hypothetical protein